MRLDETGPIVARLSGYWPTPPITEEEAAAFLRELTDRGDRGITVEEARTVIDDLVRAGTPFRPRPGEIVARVHALRRHERLMNPAPALTEARVGYEASSADFLQGIAACKAALATGDPNQDYP